MGDNAVIDTIIGMVMPGAIAVLNQSHWGPRMRGAIALAACVVAATVTSWVRGDLHWADWRASTVVILGAALISYRVWWQPTTIAPTVEAATTITAPKV